MAHELNKSWQCSLCQAIYCSLPLVVGHIRASHSHEHGLLFVCGISGCPISFKNTNTFYKHVRDTHRDRYESLLKVQDVQQLEQPIGSRNASAELVVNSSMETSEATDSVSPTDLDTCTVQLATPSPKEVAAGYLLKLRCKPGITQSTLTEVVHMNQAVLRSALVTVSDQLSDALLSSGIQLDSPLAGSIAGVLDSQSDALAGLDTPYHINSLLQSTHPIVVS